MMWIQFKGSTAWANRIVLRIGILVVFLYGLFDVSLVSRDPPSSGPMSDSLLIAFD